MIDDFNYKGGIGSYLQDAAGKMILIFSNPVDSKSAMESEVDAIFHLIDWMIKFKLELKRTLICSDSSAVVNAFNEGIFIKFLLKTMEFNHLQFINSSIFIHFVPRYLKE